MFRFTSTSVEACHIVICVKTQKYTYRRGNTLLTTKDLSDDLQDSCYSSKTILNDFIPKSRIHVAVEITFLQNIQIGKIFAHRHNFSIFLTLSCSYYFYLQASSHKFPDKYLFCNDSQLTKSFQNQNADKQEYKK